MRPFPGPPARVQVSSGGGTEPMWAPDGRTLYYRTEKEMIAVTVATTPTFAVLSRKSLFEGNYALGTIHQGYDVSKDGRHFLMLPRIDQGTQMVIVANWLDLMRRKFEAQQATR